MSKGVAYHTKHQSRIAIRRKKRFGAQIISIHKIWALTCARNEGQGSGGTLISAAEADADAGTGHHHVCRGTERPCIVHFIIFQKGKVLKLGNLKKRSGGSSAQGLTKLVRASGQIFSFLELLRSWPS